MIIIFVFDYATIIIINTIIIKYTFIVLLKKLFEKKSCLTIFK